VQQRLARLRRQGVVADAREHTPGSFVVTLAPLREMLAAGRRRKDPAVKPPPSNDALRALEPATIDALRLLATYTLDGIGVPGTDAMIADEMLRQFSRLASAIGNGPDREGRLREAIASALQEPENL
jgi:hypothetical protein